ncbi:TetR/AcrR family transcriptional regulator [Lactobacillus panisapium]|uniref:TetR/AcrR family transcriptional regulator n=1 Tax=Lactobacillus panisapium TaxID=2012495 RepID=A0ABX8W8F8_9LACO|nr:MULTISPECIES: TetR/AcrR family transcriptional regulator [Lactobacillus]MCO6531223.1 TetR/AcrR family transcriptional regulator [Lactobacillus sp.]MCT6853883.1 TetR/AcrR family transcriptional regulator [Lactobacillus panisapium]MCX8735779.1 TetR/AcrR family transcriptional regulator [Lactobacillus sp. B4026]QYN52438.1 TetR/AcrR family transcriptional regulator [Lactobacillus panisapium]QYN54323.1 TetR/AcrR family transcriptional regulator [Lactobacillus panisapium]
MVKVLASYQEEIANQEIPSGKKKVLLAGLKLFSKKGFHATTTAEIAHEAGVSEGTIYKYFKSKDDLLAKLLSPMLTEIKDNFFVQLDDYHDLTKLISFLVEDRIQFLLINFDFLKLFIQELLTDNKIIDLIKTEVTGKNGVFAYFDDLKKRFGEINSDLTSIQLLRIFISPIFTYVVQVKVFGINSQDKNADLALIKKQIYLGLTA